MPRFASSCLLAPGSWRARCLTLVGALPGLWLLGGSALPVAPVLAQSAVPAAFSVGNDVAIVGVGSDGLRLRSGPGLTYAPGVTLPEGTVLRVAAGPVNDGEQNWYQLRGSVDGARARGWAPGPNLVDPARVSPQRDGAVGTRSFLAKTIGYASGGGIGYYTATGTQVRWGTVAVDPRFIPLGSLLMIQGFEGIFVAEDTGPGVREAMVDIWFPELAQAQRYGTQYREVVVLREGYGS